MHEIDAELYTCADRGYSGRDWTQRHPSKPVFLLLTYSSFIPHRPILFPYHTPPQNSRQKRHRICRVEISPHPLSPPITQTNYSSSSPPSSPESVHTSASHPHPHPTLPSPRTGQNLPTAPYNPDTPGRNRCTSRDPPRSGSSTECSCSQPPGTGQSTRCTPCCDACQRRRARFGSAQSPLSSLPS